MEKLSEKRINIFFLSSDKQAKKILFSGQVLRIIDTFCVRKETRIIWYFVEKRGVEETYLKTKFYRPQVQVQIACSEISSLA